MPNACQCVSGSVREKVFFFCLSHTRWFDEVLVTLLPSLGDDGESEKL